MKKYILLMIITVMLAVTAVDPFTVLANEINSTATIEYKTEPTFSSTYAGSRFEKGSMNSDMYEAMKTFFEKAAKGEISTAKLAIPEQELPKGLSWTESQLGATIVENGEISEAAYKALEKKLNEKFDLSRVVQAVLSDCPYEQFW